MQLMDADVLHQGETTMKRLLFDEERFYTGLFLLLSATTAFLFEYKTTSVICAVIGFIFQITAFLQVQGKLYWLEILMRMERDNLKWSKDRVPPIRERFFIK